MESYAHLKFEHNKIRAQIMFCIEGPTREELLKELREIESKMRDIEKKYL